MLGQFFDFSVKIGNFTNTSTTSTKLSYINSSWSFLECEHLVIKSWLGCCSHCKVRLSFDFKLFSNDYTTQSSFQVELNDFWVGCEILYRLRSYLYSRYSVKTNLQ